jgi:hypothetical protein
MSLISGRLGLGYDLESKGATMIALKRTVIILMSVGVIAFVFALLSACTSGPVPVKLDGDEKEAVLAFSEPAADNLFVGMNSGDYATFSHDFNAAMLKGIDEKGFVNLQNTLTPKIGKYRTRTVASVEEIGEYYRLTYRAGFEEDENVKVLLTFEKAEPHKVAGLFFTSDKLK